MANPVAFLNPWDISTAIDNRMRRDELYDLKLESEARQQEIDNVRLQAAQLRLDEASAGTEVSALKRQKDVFDLSLNQAGNAAMMAVNEFLQKNPNQSTASAADSLLLTETDPLRVTALRNLRDRAVVTDAQKMFQVGSSQGALSILFENNMLPGVTRIPTADGEFAYVTSDGTPVDPVATFAALNSGKLSPFMNAQRLAENQRRIAMTQQEGMNARTLATIAARLGSKTPTTTSDLTNLLDQATKTRAAAYKEFDAALKAAAPSTSGPRSEPVQKVLDQRVAMAQQAVQAVENDVAVLKRNLGSEPQRREPVSRYSQVVTPSSGTTPVTTALSVPIETRQAENASVFPLEPFTYTNSDFVGPPNEPMDSREAIDFDAAKAAYDAASNRLRSFGLSQRRADPSGYAAAQRALEQAEQKFILAKSTFGRSVPNSSAVVRYALP